MSGRSAARCPGRVAMHQQFGAWPSDRLFGGTSSAQGKHEATVKAAQASIVAAPRYPPR